MHALFALTSILKINDSFYDFENRIHLKIGIDKRYFGPHIKKKKMSIQKG